MSEVLWFRRLLAAHQIGYLLHFWSDPEHWFGGIVVWTLALVGWTLFALFPRGMGVAAQCVLLGLQLSLHHANPFVIHEPQQLANFFLIVSILWPREADDPAVPGLKRGMIAMLAIYYGVAGFKKLPDPLWLNGDAIGVLLRWPPLELPGGPTFLSRFLLENSWAARWATWGTLIFELGFGVVAATHLRRVLIPIGILFHTMIALTLEVGSFSGIMLPWYCFLWSRPGRPGDACLSRARHRRGNGKGSASRRQLEQPLRSS